jgi:hypothetical protein
MTTLPLQRYSSEGTTARMAEVATDMVNQIAFCLAVESDESLQRGLWQACGAPEEVRPLFVQPQESGVWLALNGIQSMRIVRDLPPGPANAFSMNYPPEGHEQLWSDLVQAGWRVDPQRRAARLLSSVFRAGSCPTAREMADLQAWAPLIEIAGYRYFTYASMLLDEMRQTILQGSLTPAERESALSEYWSVLHCMGHIMTVVSTPGAKSWLGEMAMSLTWTTWTPSFVLSRERTLWLMAAAAKSAVAFGEPVVDRYLTKLVSRDHPIKGFDALLGLVSIGLDRPSIREGLSNEIEKCRKDVDRANKSDGHFGHMLECALRVLRDPGSSDRQLSQLQRSSRRKEISPNIFGLDAVRLDPTALVGANQYLGLLALPFIIRTSPSSYYPTIKAAGVSLRPREILQILNRAWAGRARSSRELLH